MISLIAAVAANGVIGSDNRMPWHITEDLKRFKALTSGHPVVMGRKTWESLGRALPGRTNIVITRNTEYRAEGATVVDSLVKAIASLPDSDVIFVIGGGEIYRQAMAMADRLYITHISVSVDGDTRFPSIDPELWNVTYREYHERGSQFPHPFEFVDYVRR